MSLLQGLNRQSSTTAGGGGSVVPSFDPRLDTSFDEEDDPQEHHALAVAVRMQAQPAEVEEAVASPPVVRVHRPPAVTTSGGVGGHARNNSLLGLSDIEIEASPTLKKGAGQSEATRRHSIDHDGVGGGGAVTFHHHDSHTIEMPAKRSSMMFDGAGGHAGGGEEELEHVMPSLDRLNSLRKMLNHFAWNLGIFLVIAADVVLIVFKVALARNSNTLQLITVILIGFFLFEIFLRIIAFGREFFRNIRFVIYSLTTIAAFLILVDAFAISVSTRDICGIVLQCASAGLRFVAFFCELAPAARAMVSTNKARYQQNGFDLDLTYISDRLIAMGLPSTSLEAVYRNPIDEVARFFNTMHKDHYLIINLCSERTYPSDKFHGRVVRFPFDDHNPCPLSTLLQFCVYVDNFLKQDKENVIAVHCKGGKGRTGTMCASWLLYSKPDMYAEQALKLFATFRTAQDIGGRLQGVSGPSQKRYAGYFESLRFVTPRGAPRDNVLLEAYSHLRNTPPMELVSLTLNHVAPIDAAKEMRSGVAGGAFNQKARDVHNSQWNKSRNWSLLITYYPPISTYDVAGAATAGAADEADEDPEHWTANTINRRNLARYQDTKEFYFPAREKEMSSNDDSVTFDISSFASQAKSLILTGDLKFQVFRGNLAASLHTVGTTGGASGRRDGGHDDHGDHAPSGASDESKPFVYCWFWLNTSFANQSATSVLLRKEQLDEVNRDAKVDPEMNLALDYHCPPRPESWAHAPHPTFHLIPAAQPISPPTPASKPIDDDEDDE